MQNVQPGRAAVLFEPQSQRFRAMCFPPDCDTKKIKNKNRADGKIASLGSILPGSKMKSGLSVINCFFFNI